MKQLIIPVYLNQKLVFDLLAMLQGGMSTVTAVSTKNSESANKEGNISTGFGLSEAFSTLLKIDLSAKKTNKDSKENESSTSEERVHTPASMFYQLRNLLIEKKHLKEFTITNPPIAGDFIEFEGYLKRNPMIETLDSLAAIMDVAELFETGTNTNRKKGKSSNQISEHTQIKKQMLDFSNMFKAGNTIDLTVTNLNSGYTSIITVEEKFLNDPMMADIVDGKFKIIGKVIRSINDESDSLSLLRKTALSKMPDNMLNEMFRILSTLGLEQGFNIPNMIWKIKGPVIHVLPVAIYA